MLRGSFFEVSGFGAQYVLRLGSSLITTRLLFPAAFGLASIVFVITTGLVMLSDVAVQPCIVQSKRGDEPAFLNTAFTIQAIRGVVLALLMVAFARPISWFYREPALAPLIYLGSLQMIIGGLHSTSIFTLRRKLQLGWINALELSQSVVAIPLTILLAWLLRSAWAIVIASTAAALFTTSASHFLPVGYRNRFRWDKAAAREIGGFGRWILGSSAVTFLGGQADRILLGRFLGTAWLGIYGVALNLSDAIASLAIRVIHGVMYPALSQAARDPDLDVSRFYYRIRGWLDLLTMSATGLLAGLGGWIVRLLWDQRYADAGWILRILCVRTAIGLIVGPCETCLFSLGHTRYGFLRSAARLVGALVCIPIGWYLGGVRGVVWGTTIAEAFTIFAVWPKGRQLGFLRIWRELLSIGIFAAAFALGNGVLRFLPAWHIR